MTLDAALALGITAFALVLFVSGRLRADVVALLTATLLVVTGLVSPAQAVSGFSNEATVTVALLLVLAVGLRHTGAVELAVAAAIRLAGKGEVRLLLLTIAVVVPLSAVINNTATVAILLPAVLGAARQIGAAPSRLLLPLSFGGQLGGTLTLIGSTTNLLVAGLMVDIGLDRIHIFDITPVGVFVAAAGGLYLVTLGRWLTPHRPEPQDLLESYELHDYLTGLRIAPDSPIVGRTIGESRFGRTQGLQIIRIRRADGTRVADPHAATVLRAGDLLIVEGKITDIARIRSAAGVEIEGADPDLPDPAAAGDEDDPVRLAEVLVPPRLTAPAATLRSLRLRTRFGVSALALRRHGEPIHQRLGSVRLRPGDVLLVQGRTSGLRQMHDTSALSLVGAVDLPPHRRPKMKWAVLILIATLLIAALEILPIMVAAMAGVVALLITRTLTADEAYAEVDWSVIVLLGAILPLGIALLETGAAALIAERIARVAVPLGPWVALASVYLLTTILTNLISNAAAAALVLPVAASLADGAGLSPLPFAVAVMFAASNAFLTPFGYQTNLFVYGPGNYRFSDFLRVGAPLTVITAATAIFAIPRFFPFQP